MSAADAASALGVRLPTIYAYVSRGVLSRDRVPGADGRLVSRFDRDEVLAIARARRPSRSGRVLDLIESDVTQIDPAGALSYRGLDIGELVERGFEATARIVLKTEQPWPTVERHAVPDSGPTDPMDTMRRALLDQAMADPERFDVGGEHCRRVGLQAVEAACTAVTGRSKAEGSVAERLAAFWARGVGWRHPTRARAVPDEVVVGIDTALCVLADHDLTGSTLATRAAAGVHADPWMAVLAGHAALGGSRQGSASVAAVEVVRRWRANASRDSTAPWELAPLAGFGHVVYEGPDPRAVALLRAARRVDVAVAADVESLCVEVARRCSAHPNVDIGLAALVLAGGLPCDAGTTLYGIARLVGLAAHASEEYPHGIRLRPRSVASRPPHHA